MMYRRFFRHLIILSLIIALLAIAAVGVGCRGQETPASPPAERLASTMVPARDLDIYIYIKQASATKVPLSLIGASADIMVESLAIWGVAREDDKFTIGGALTFASAADAAKIHSQIPGQTGVWTKLADRTIYFVQGSGGPAESLKSLISANNFKRYNDNKALQEVALMPDSGSTRSAAIGVIRPNKALINTLKQYTDSATAERIDTIFTWAKPEVITIGLYAPQQLDIADIAKRVLSNTIWDADLGVIASIKSSIPGAIVSPIATGFLDSAGYAKSTLGNLTVYKSSFNVGQIIPLLLNVDGNRVFVTVSGKESYAQTLMTSIRR